MKFKIESDGSIANTKIFINDNLVGGIQYLEIVLDSNNNFVEIKQMKFVPTEQTSNAQTDQH